ncbi:PTS system, N-acetylgalactosamine-specific IIA component [Caloramator quimbayensis]|uniref:PTS system, N-acetylgalactosamine-specific IIA component n=1 Tax=Caloramator quimbayensis TaxID=1147123 RepID=A0A1T4WPI5_9CLOT|nr:PTS sugar transporter subunit IIA [Caloramator quimbayensis]SKA78531.1 PTS system, N-acetylgalactosamine-specific IIA component [Caloramator quimbayensis]
MRKIIILTGHGNFATGLKSSVNLIAGLNNDLYAVDFTVEDSDITLKDKIKKILDENSNLQVLFVCDIAGGTPFKVAAEISNYNDNFEVTAGCNISSLLEVHFQKDMLTISELAEHIVNISKNSVMKFKKVSNGQTLTVKETEEGI